jgi:hypothetical protein
MGALSTPGAKVVMAGNPTRTSGFFYDTHHSLRDRWHTMHVNCLDVPRAQGHIEDIKAKYGDNSNAWRVRVLGEFPTADDETVIPLELVMSAVGRDVSSLSYYPVWGVDVARFGDDRTALAKRQANKLLEPIRWWHSTDLMVTVGRIKAEYDETHYDMRPWAILIDVIGLGAGVYDRCKELGQQHHPAVRGDPATVEGGGDFLALNGWKPERQGRIVGHGGCGRLERWTGLASTTESYATAIA